MTKAELYARIDDIRKRYKYAFTRDPMCVQRFCQEVLDIHVETRVFATRGLRGAAFIESMAIALDETMAPERRKFYCAHEMLHFFLHGDAKPLFECYDNIERDDYMEWQANEGAAEIIMPYRAFLYEVLNAAPYMKSGREFFILKKQLVDFFGVTPVMVKVRFDNLKYEVKQALSGVPIEEVELLSDRQQRTRGLEIVSLNEFYPDRFIDRPLTLMMDNGEEPAWGMANGTW